jgi:hypothetical protein
LLFRAGYRHGTDDDDTSGSAAPDTGDTEALRRAQEQGRASHQDLRREILLK